MKKILDYALSLLLIAIMLFLGYIVLDGILERRDKTRTLLTDTTVASVALFD